MGSDKINSSLVSQIAWRKFVRETDGSLTGAAADGLAADPAPVAAAPLAGDGVRAGHVVAAVVLLRRRAAFRAGLRDLRERCFVLFCLPFPGFSHHGSRY